MEVDNEYIASIGQAVGRCFTNSTPVIASVVDDYKLCSPKKRYVAYTFDLTVSTEPIKHTEEMDYDDID